MSSASFIDLGLISIVISQLLSISKLVLIEFNISEILNGSNKFGVPPPIKIVLNLDFSNLLASFSMSLTISLVYLLKSDSSAKTVELKSQYGYFEWHQGK